MYQHMQLSIFSLLFIWRCPWKSLRTDCNIEVRFVSLLVVFSAVSLVYLNIRTICDVLLFYFGITISVLLPYIFCEYIVFHELWTIVKIIGIHCTYLNLVSFQSTQTLFLPFYNSKLPVISGVMVTTVVSSHDSFTRHCTLIIILWVVFLSNTSISQQNQFSYLNFLRI